MALPKKSAGTSTSTSTTTSSKTASMSYEVFKAKIKGELKKRRSGSTWREIKRKLRLPQKVPNNKWVALLEKDIGLKRIKQDNITIWRLS